MKKDHFSVDLISHRDNIVFRIHTYDLEISDNEKIDYPEVHAHHYDEIHYIYQGSTTLMLADDKPDVVLSKGDFCVVPAGVYHCRLSDGVDKVIFALEILEGDQTKKSSTKAYKKLRAILDSTGMPFVFNDQRITDTMLRYRDIKDEDTICKETQNASILMSAILYAFNSFDNSDMLDTKSASALPPDNTTDKRKLIIENHIDDFFNVQDGLKKLAAKLYLSERRTSEIVREIMGESFKDLVVKERMTVANILIKCKKYQLEEIATMVGYHSYSGFYTAYKKFFGRPPTDDIV